jgi:hypothetical protein
MPYPNAWKPKGLIEHLCQQQTFAPDDTTRDAITELLNVLWMHRPDGVDGKHHRNDLCTPTCGCDN